MLDDGGIGSGICSGIGSGIGTRGPRVVPDDIAQLLRRSVEGYGQTTVMVTHDPAAAAIADRILFLADGVIRLTLGPSTSGEILAALAEVSR